MKSCFLPVGGASGAIYGVRLLEVLHANGIPAHPIVASGG